MGARINYVFKQDEGMPSLVLYSHWGETEWRSDLSFALSKAAGRLSMGDTAYATRIIISYLIGPEWDKETGFGLYLADENQEYWDTTVEIDVNKQLVNDEGNWHSFEDFIKYENSKVAYSSSQL